MRGTSLRLIPPLLLLLTGIPGVSWAETGWASWYSKKSCQREGTSGVYTASGDLYLEDRMTCALPHRDFHGTYRVTSLATGKSVLVRHNDAGPGRGARARGTIIDLTPAAFSALGHPLSEGRIPVTVEKIQ